MCSPSDNNYYRSITQLPPLNEAQKASLKYWMDEEGMLGYGNTNYNFLVKCGISRDYLFNQTARAIEKIYTMNTHIPEDSNVDGVTERMPALQIRLLRAAVERTRDATNEVAQNTLLGNRKSED